MELCQATNIFATNIKCQHFGVSLKFLFGIESTVDVDLMCLKNLNSSLLTSDKQCLKISDYLHI